MLIAPDTDSNPATRKPAVLCAGWARRYESQSLGNSLGVGWSFLKILQVAHNVCTVGGIHRDFTHRLAYWYLHKSSMVVPMTCGKSLVLANVQW